MRYFTTRHASPTAKPAANLPSSFIAVTKRAKLLSTGSWYKKAANGKSSTPSCSAKVLSPACVKNKLTRSLNKAACKLYSTRSATNSQKLRRHEICSARRARHLRLQRRKKYVHATQLRNSRS